MFLRTLYILFLILGGVNFSVGQTKIDSLKNKLLKITNDTGKVEVFNSIGWEYRGINQDSTIKYCKSAYDLANKINYTKGIIEANAFIGVAFRNMGNYKKALSYYYKNIQLYKTTGIKPEVAYTYINIANVLTYQLNYPEALEYLYKALAIGKKAKNTNILGYCYINLARVYTKNKKYQKAINSHQKAYKIRKKNKDFAGMAASERGIGVCYFNLKNYEKALGFYNLSYQHYEAINAGLSVASTVMDIAKLYLETGKIKLAEKNYLKALEYYNNTNFDYGIIKVQSALGEIYFMQGKQKKAEKIILNSWKICNKNNSNTNRRRNSKILSEIYHKLNKPKLAYKYLLIYKKINDSIKELENTDEFTKIEMEHNYKEKQAIEKAWQLKKDIETKKEIEKRKIVSIFLILGLVISSIFIVFVLIALKKIKYKNQALISKNEEIKQQNEEIRSQAESISNQAKEIEAVNIELEKLSLVASETANAVLITDKKGNIEWVNKSFIEIYGYELDELKNHFGENIIGKFTTDTVKIQIKNLFDNKQTVRYEQELPTKHHGKKWIKTTLTPILDKNNNVKKLVAIDTDITILKLAKKELQRKHNDIKASIKYAQKIQQSILPLNANVDEMFDNFIIFHPKHTVSGDFYWISQVRDSIFFDSGKKYKFFAVVDCTGHGVPGAFMSMIGNRMLNEIVNEKEVYDTAEILELLNKKINRALKQKDNKNSDGMDVCLCRFEEEQEKIKVCFTGAKRPLFVYNKNENKITRIKGDRKSIGGSIDNKLSFTKTELFLEKGDIIYLTTDGFIDQNGPKTSRYGTPKLIELFSRIANNSLKKQKQLIETELLQWKQGLNQRDDITITGIKIG